MSGVGVATNNECITVVVRCRPMNRKENEENRKSIISIDMPARQITITNPDAPGDAPKSFTFDATYDEKTQQRIFYEESCFNIIDSTLEGFNSTIFAYGQTGCGKSFTMQGPSVSDDDLKGVIPNSFSQIFQFVKSTPDIEFLIRCSYLELYNEEIRDLLGNPKSNTKCELREDPSKGIYVTGLTDVVVESPEDLSRMLDKGLTNRTVASTLMNSESSRSHSIFTIVVEMNTKDELTGKDMLRVGKLNLVDLAGSERAKKTGAKGAVLQEGIKINLSLSVLGNVISALAEGGRHIPYRDSKLTRLLQDSLGGNTKTMMVAAISPADYNYEETLSTLRYANRAKNIKNKPKINEDPKDAMIREFKAEIEKLRKMLAEQAVGGNVNFAAMFGAAPVPAAPPAQFQSSPQSVASGPDSSVMPTQPAAPKQSSTRPKPATKAQAKSSPPKAMAVSNDKKENDCDMDSYNDDQGYASPRTKTFQQQEEEEMYEDAFETLSPEHSKPNAAHPAAYSSAELTQDQQQVIRDELANRLHQLEHMLVNHEEDVEEVKEDLSPRLNASMKMSMKHKSAEQIKEEDDMRAKYKERKMKAKKKKEDQQEMDMQRILEEKKMMEDELEELRHANKSQSTAQTGSDDGLVKKMSKMKKRYEKKVASVKEELEELKEEFSYQRKQLLESMIEQEKDSKLYELICRSILSEKDLQKIIEKCRYDEESDEWIVPFTKKKNIDQVEMTMSPGISKPIGGSLLLPDIHSSAPMHQNKDMKHFDQTMRLVSSPLHSARSDAQTGRKESKRVVPLLTLPGTLMTAADVMAANSSRLPELDSYNHNASYSNYEQSDGLKEEKKAKKNINKVPKAGNCKTDKMPQIGATNNGYGIASDKNYEDYGEIRDSEEGDAVGPWGFVLDKKGKKENNPELEYSDDEDFVASEETQMKKKKKKKRDKKSENHDSNSLPPIDNKYHTPRGGGTSLPPI